MSNLPTPTLRVTFRSLLLGTFGGTLICAFAAYNDWAMNNTYLIGNNMPVQLMRYITAVESALGIKARMEMLPMQPGDVPATAADVSRLEAWVNFRPQTSVETGIERFIAWYRGYYQV
mgnify:CR=1 FL=1